jgi:tetratricopeptide (TPR) repeat protein
METNFETQIAKTLPFEIEEAIEKNELVFFIGSGLSIPAGLPDWEGLTNSIIMKIQERNPGCLNYEAIQKAKSPLDLLSELEKDYHFEIIKFLTEIIDIPFNEAALSRHRQIWRLTDQVITTNFDCLLDSAIQYEKKDYIPVITHANLTGVASLKQNSSFYFKVHGCIKDVKNCILFKNQYKILYSFNKSGAILRLFQILSNSTIIFLGFGLKDPYVRQLLRLRQKVFKGMTPSHFIITKETKEYKKLGVKPILVRDFGKDLDDLLNLIELKRKDTPPLLAELINNLNRAGKTYDRKKLQDNFNKFIEYSQKIRIQSAEDFRNKSIEEIEYILLEDLKALEWNFKLLKEGTKEYDELQYQVAEKYFELFSFYSLEFKVELAEKYILRACETSDDNPQYLIRYADLLSEKDEFRKSVKIYEKVISILNKTQNDPELLTIAYNNYALSLKYLGEFSDSEVFLKKALQFEKNSLPAYINLSVLNIKLSKYNEAITNLNDYFVRTKSIDHDKKELGFAYLTISDAYRHLHKLQEALDYNEKAENVFEELDLMLNPNCWYLYDSKGSILMEQHKFADALEYFTLSHSLYSQHLSKEHHKTGLALQKIGECYYHLEEPDSALEAYNECLKIFKNIYGSNHVEIGRVYADIGNLFRYLKDYNTAIDKYLIANKIFCLNSNESTNEIIFSLRDIGSCYLALNDDEGIKYYIEAISMQEKLNLTNSEDYCNNLCELGYLYQIANDFDLGEATIRRGIDACQSIGSLSTKDANKILKDIHENTINKIPNYIFFDKRSFTKNRK